MNDQELDLIRRAYARNIYFASRADDPRLEAALFDVRRDVFMGPGPWRIGGMGPPMATPNDDPSWLYQDAVVELMPEKALPSGVPSFLTSLISLGRIREGEHVAHIGAGVGYYTAIMARLAGQAGRVTAIEYEPALAERAAVNLATYPQVQTVCGDGADYPLAPADLIFVNAGAARPLDNWLDALKDGGRLILPLTVGPSLPSAPRFGRGFIFLIERHGEEYAVACKGQVAIYLCLGAQDAQSEASLRAAMRGGGQEKVRRLRRTSEVPDETCWAKGPGWALTFA